jgi:hypothetical protein
MDPAFEQLMVDRLINHLAVSRLAQITALTSY